MRQENPGTTVTCMPSAADLLDQSRHLSRAALPELVRIETSPGVRSIDQFRVMQVEAGGTSAFGSGDVCLRCGERAVVPKRIAGEINEYAGVAWRVSNSDRSMMNRP